ncbi:hypothetical protein QBC35DRAFT_136658 [Podospora australis]|uniref:Peroxin 11c n=1 Tax=Podospora australis TaxID=1536484 RepID=A0AAN6X0Z5_9PEZI|nr:hypothetical protein QBC35DRAFT_136658 [Podospora australis]
MADANPSPAETGEITALAPTPIADLPSGEPIPSPVSAPPAGKPKPLPISALLSALPSNTDALVSRLEKCLSTPSGIDTVMLFLCYTSKLSATVLTALSTSALQRSAREWIALRLPLLPQGTTVLLSTPGAAGSSPPPLPALALLAAKRLNALSALMSEARVILRLWALLGIYSWARSLIRKSLSSSEEKTSKLATTLEYTRVALCLALQTLENGAYLSFKGVMGWTPAQQAKAYKWSSRFWAAFVGIEIGKLLAARYSPAAKVQSAEEKETWKKNLTKSLAWAPLTIHWSTDKGVVPDAMVGLLASIPGVIQFRDLWASTAPKA